jgi:hypothetical protein
VVRGRIIKISAFGTGSALFHHFHHFTSALNTKRFIVAKNGSQRE